MQCTCKCFATAVLSPLQAKMWAPLISNLQVTCMLPEPMWLMFLKDSGCARQDRKSLFERGPPVLGNSELLTPNLVHR